MNKKLLLGSSVVIAIAAILVGPVFAEFSSTPKLDEDASKLLGKKNPKLVKFVLDGNDPVPRHGEIFGGYGVLIEEAGDPEALKALLVVTSHDGFYDSEEQIPPPNPLNTIPSSPFAEVCDNQTLDCGPEWHSHLAILLPENEKCKSGLQIGALTYEQPSQVDIQGKRILLSKIQKSGTFTESVSGTLQHFMLGKNTGNLVSFDLVPEGNPLPVCVENISPIEPSKGKWYKDWDNDKHRDD